MSNSEHPSAGGGTTISYILRIQLYPSQKFFHTKDSAIRISAHAAQTASTSFLLFGLSSNFMLHSLELRCCGFELVLHEAGGMMVEIDPLSCCGR